MGQRPDNKTLSTFPSLRSVLHMAVASSSCVTFSWVYYRCGSVAFQESLRRYRMTVTSFQERERKSNHREEEGPTGARKLARE